MSMNATSLYVSTCRLILQADSDDPNSWIDLYRLVPYLRQSLSCTVCSNLLIEPHTPTETNCQHHVCRTCRGGRKKLKPSCGWCKDYDKYIENVQLRILLQCYKKLCHYLTSSHIYQCLLLTGSTSTTNAVNAGSTTGKPLFPADCLTELIKEGAGFKDEFNTNHGLSKMAYSILPCVYTTSTTSTQTTTVITSNLTTLHQPQQPIDPLAAQHSIDVDSHSSIDNTLVNDNTVSTLCASIPITQNETLKMVSNGSSIYSVMYAGSGNKITIKRKATNPAVVSDNIATGAGVGGQQLDNILQSQPLDTIQQLSEPQQLGLVKCIPASHLYQQCQVKKSVKSNKKPRSNPVRTKRKGCRCGNATAVPGKLTCCGQRCPCYVESKPCLECRCRGCRNPHTRDGYKIRPHIPELHNLQLQLSSPLDSDTMTTDPLGSTRQCLSVSPTIQVLNVYSTPKLDIDNVSQNLPAALLVGEDAMGSTESEADDSDIQIDV
ncbi:uncharacterized protein LOC131663512 [Phymastichus coffea]|uniref:uncharacterized protein LOC131663512 n=1 Tax=Phymastichus coffea TaxID=108790 RepID=UPI00273AC033|nr:uncharacterized protein LOC131663512 [Phymastichus coffea]